MKKLTLSADDEVIAQAKGIAAREGTSVSALFARFIRSIARRGKSAPSNVPPGSIAARAGGFIALPRGKTPRDVLTEALMDKYGRKR